MRYTTAVQAAFVAGAMAKPHSRRSKTCTSAAEALSALASDAPSSQGTTATLVPVPPPAVSTTPAYIVPSAVPTGNNGTIPQSSAGNVAASVAILEDASSALPVESGPVSSDVPAASSAVDASITSSALPAESSGPVSAVPVGQVIYSCTVPGTFAMTYDDGPFTYTDHVLDLLAKTDIKATFFVNGNNFGNINDFQDVVRRMIADGHQVGSHTYAHQDLATLGDAGVITAMTELEEALDAIIGKTPTYMRPPYFSYTDQNLAVLGELGYHVIQADIDTFDYANSNIGNLTGATNLQAGIAKGGTIALAHDVHQNTAEVLTPEFIRMIQASGLRGVTVGECLGDPAENWYRSRRTTTPTATSGPTSTVSITSLSTPTGPVDSSGGSCGGNTGFFCAPGMCCSEYGFCGTSQAYCAAGCQPEFGVCGVMVSAAPVTNSAPAPTGGVSPDGSCGGTDGYTCIPGTCCSQYGFCGTTTAHCGTGCQNAFGVCGLENVPVASGTSSAAPVETGGVSPDGSCGGTNAYTCTPGNCCSQYGFCGTTTDHCGTGCQSAFGICN